MVGLRGGVVVVDEEGVVAPAVAGCGCVGAGLAIKEVWEVVGWERG